MEVVLPVELFLGEVGLGVRGGTGAEGVLVVWGHPGEVDPLHGVDGLGLGVGVGLVAHRGRREQTGARGVGGRVDLGGQRGVEDGGRVDWGRGCRGRVGGCLHSRGRMLLTGPVGSVPGSSSVGVVQGWQGTWLWMKGPGREWEANHREMAVRWPAVERGSLVHHHMWVEVHLIKGVLVNVPWRGRFIAGTQVHRGVGIVVLMVITVVVVRVPEVGRVTRVVARVVARVTVVMVIPRVTVVMVIMRVTVVMRGMS